MEKVFSLRAAVVLISCILNITSLSASVPIPKERPYTYKDIDIEAISFCRKTFPEVEANPSEKGGIKFSKISGGATIVCLYGTLEDVSSNEILSLGKIYRKFIVVARSTGGPVEAWLTFAETNYQKVSYVIVDEACFSSCANYGFILGKTKKVGTGGLVVWHGGPTAKNAKSRANGEISYLAGLVRRTATLYEKLGISVSILDATSRGDFSKTAIDEASKLLHMSSRDLHFVGYGLPPRLLSDCFGFTGLKLMWHPGSERATIAAGLARSRNLLIAEQPTHILDYCQIK